MKGKAASWRNTVIAGEEWLVDGRVGGRGRASSWPEPGGRFEVHLQFGRRRRPPTPPIGGHATPATPIGQQHTPATPPTMVGPIVVPITAAMVSNNETELFSLTLFL